MMLQISIQYSAEVGISAPGYEAGSIGLNDMSLPYGGLFDIHGAWSASHYRHRFGTDVDIDQKLLSGTEYKPINQALLFTIAEEWFDAITLSEPGGRMHFQLPEYTAADVLVRGTK